MLTPRWRVALLVSALWVTGLALLALLHLNDAERTCERLRVGMSPAEVSDVIENRFTFGDDQNWSRIIWSCDDKSEVKVDFIEGRLTHFESAGRLVLWLRDLQFEARKNFGY